MCMHIHNTSHSNRRADGLGGLLALFEFQYMFSHALSHRPHKATQIGFVLRISAVWMGLSCVCIFH